MRSLAGIRARLDELLTAHEEKNQPPAAVVLLPENHRGPDYDGPWPYVRRVGAVAVVVYRIEDGQPSTAGIARLLAGEGTQQ
jgi:hypothetical protein